MTTFKNLSKLIFLGAGLVLMTSSVSSALGVWAFAKETSDTGSVDYEADVIEENAIFSDGYDYAETGARAYDVYFMSQMCDITTHILAEDGTVDTVILKDHSSSTSTSTSASTNVTTVTNYTFRYNLDPSDSRYVPYPVPYYVENDPDDELLTYDSSNPNGTAPQDYGMWMDGDEPLPNNLTSSANRYFKKYQAVKELSADIIENQVGQPHFSLADGSNGNWACSFAGWTPCYNLPVYYRDEVSTATLYPALGTRVTTQLSTGARKTDGYAPYSDVFTTLYAGTLLEYYERLSSGGSLTYTPLAPVGASAITYNFVWYINGRPSIFFFPTYVADGKNYTNSSYYKDAIRRETVTTDESGNETTQEELFVYDGIFTTTISNALKNDETTTDYANASGVRYECYRLPRKHFYEADNISYAIATDTRSSGSAWQGDWRDIFSPIADLVVGDYVNMYIILKADTATDEDWAYKDIRSRTVTIGTTVRADDDISIITEAERAVIDEALDGLGVIKYYARPYTVGTLGGGQATYQLSSSESRDYYVVYERLYEPKLVGGEEGSVQYDNNNYRFVKQGVTGGLNHNFIARNIDLSGKTPDGEYTYTYGGHEVTVHYPSTYFGVLLCHLDVMIDQEFNYDLVVGQDYTSNPAEITNTDGTTSENPDKANPTPPELDTSDTFNADKIYFSSQSIFEPVFPESWTVTLDDGSTTTRSYTPSSDPTSESYNPDWVDEYTESVEAYVTVDGKTDVNERMTLKAAYEAGTYGLADNYSMVRIKPGKQGVYTIMFQMEYEERTKWYNPSGVEITQEEAESLGTAGVNYYVITRNVPDLCTVWGYSFSDKFINICDITTNPEHLIHRSKNTFADRYNYVDTSIYSYGSENLAFGSYLSKETKFWWWEQREDALESEALTFADLYQERITDKIDAEREMVDLVTGQIITPDNIDDFQVNRYSVFVIKYTDQEIAYSDAT